MRRHKVESSYHISALSRHGKWIYLASCGKGWSKFGPSMFEAKEFDSMDDAKKKVKGIKRSTAFKDLNHIQVIEVTYSEMGV